MSNRAGDTRRVNTLFVTKHAVGHSLARIRLHELMPQEMTAQ